MKTLIQAAGLLLILVACQTTPEVSTKLEGDLYYTWLRMGSFYNWPDSLYEAYQNEKEHWGIEELRRSDPKGTAKIELLEEYGLLKSPFIYLKTDADSIYLIYMTTEDYQSLTEYNYHDLRDQHQKLRLKLATEPLAENMFLCKKLISVEKMEGETLQRERKFKIEDYR